MTLLNDRSRLDNDKFEEGYSISRELEDLAIKWRDKIAIVFGTRSITYEELDDLSNKLAVFLISRGARAECRIGLFASPSIEMIVGIIGILKAGGVYVPLDPMDPKLRIENIIGTSNVEILLTQTSLLNELPGNARNICLLDENWSVDMPATVLGRNISHPEQLAYLIHTSGTSGRPKAVQITLSNLFSHIHAFQQASAICEADRGMLFSTLAFDGSIEEIFGPLMCGGTLVIHEERPVPFATLNDLIEKHRLTLLDFSVGYWSAWVAFLAEHGERVPVCIKKVVIGGETVLASQLVEWKRVTEGTEIDLIITYGPTETTVIATSMKYGFNREEIPNIDGLMGAPLPNATVYLLDADLRPTSEGEMGDVYIGGECVSRGYLGATALTAEKFIPDPISLSAGRRMYRTGDRARATRYGAFQFLGRNDNQVKIRGFRIELEEIERTLCSFDDVQSAVVAVEIQKDQDKLLKAFIMPRGGSQINLQAIKQLLAERLPSFMIPTTIDIVRIFPTKLNGKVDVPILLSKFSDTGDAISHRNIPEARLNMTSSHDEIPDQESKLVSEMRELFAKVLGKESIGPRDNFFEEGGHSIKVLRLLSLLRVSHSVNVSMKKFFQAPTPEEFAAVVAAMQLSLREGKTAIPTTWRTAPSNVARKADI